MASHPGAPAGRVRPLSDGLRHVIVSRPGDQLAGAAVDFVRRELAPAGRLAEAGARVLTLAGLDQHLPAWAGERRRPVQEALAALAAHRSGPSEPAITVRFALWHVVVSADSAGHADAAARFIEDAAVFALDRLERMVLVWALTERPPREVTRELGVGCRYRLFILPSRLGTSQLSTPQRAEMAGQALADAVAADLGGPAEAQFSELVRPGVPLLLGVRAVRAGEEEQRRYTSWQMASRAANAALLGRPDVAMAVDPDDSTLHAEGPLPAPAASSDDGWAAAALAQRRQETAVALRHQATGWKEGLIAEFLPAYLEQTPPDRRAVVLADMLATLTPNERAIALASGYRRLMAPVTGGLARRRRLLLDSWSDDTVLGVRAVEERVAIAAGARPGGAAAAFAEVQRTIQQLQIAHEEAEGRAEPRLTLGTELAGAVRDHRAQVVPPAVRLLWAGAAGMLLASVLRLSNLPEPVAVSSAAGPLAAGGVAIWRDRRRIRRERRAAIAGLAERIAAYCDALGNWLADIWLPERQVRAMMAMASRLQQRIDTDWVNFRDRMRLEAERERERLHDAWALHLARADLWDERVDWILGGWTATAIHADILDRAAPLDPDDLVGRGTALLGLVPADLERTVLGWALDAETVAASPVSPLAALTDTEPLLAMLEGTAVPEAPRVSFFVVGEPSLPLTRHVAAQAVLFPTAQTEWVSLWAVAPIDDGEEI